MTLHELQRRLDAFNIRGEVVDIIADTGPEIVKLNQGQLSLGLRADGYAIEPSYSPFTIAEKKRKGQPYDKVTLKDTGAFWQSIFLGDVSIEKFDVDASDAKTDTLIKKYGGQILGLSADSKNEEYIPNYFFPELKARVETKLGLAMI